MLTPSKAAILTRALEALKAATGLNLALDEKQPFNSEADARIKILKASIPTLAVEIKSNIRPANIGAIIQNLKKLEPMGLLVADYINPNIGAVLRENGILYADSCGNSYINLPSLFVHIAGLKPALEIARETNRAFDATGLRLIYGFLCNQNLVNASYREMSARTGIALGSLGALLNDLKDAGHVLDPDGARERQLVNRRKLLDRWVEAYPEKLQPKLRLGEFMSLDPAWWEKFDITEFGAAWSGEVGAAKYISNLKPQIATIYLSATSDNDLLSAAKLKRAANHTTEGLGNTLIYRPFWGEKLQKSPQSLRETVHPILIYADLIATADSRNLETARLLYENSIAEYMRED